MKSYKDLEIYNESFELFLKVHPLSLKLPKHELYELGSQLRRSADSITTNIVERYGRRNYKIDFIKFLVYASASNLETICHLEKINRLYPDFNQEVEQLLKAYDTLGGKIYTFIE